MQIARSVAGRLISNVIFMNEITLFKYCSVNQHLIDSLSESTLYFATPDQLNDPFDCQVNIEKCLSGAISESNGKEREYLAALTKIPQFAEKLQKRLLGVGICSFSNTLENPLMWAHYANNHRGVNLLYKIPEQFIIDQRNRIIGLAPTEYGESPLRVWFKEVAPTMGKPGSVEMGVSLSKKLFTVKGKHWEYEQEIRVIREQAGLLTIPRNFLVQVCFGLRTSRDDILKIKKVLKSDKVNYCRISHNESDFGIKAMEI